MPKANNKLANTDEIQELPVEHLIVAAWIAELKSGWGRGAGGLGPGCGADGACVGVWVGEEDWFVR